MVSTIDKSAQFCNLLVEQYDLLDVGKSRGRRLQHTRFQAASHARLNRVYTLVSLASYVNNYNVKPVSFTKSQSNWVMGSEMRKPFIGNSGS